MSVEASYHRLTPAEFQELLEDSEKASHFFYGTGLSDEELIGMYDEREASGRYLDIQKDWQALHFLLTGKAEMDTTDVPPPLGNVVLGGTTTEWEATYNMVRYLTPEEVKAVAAALEELSEDEIQARFDFNAFQEADIYPGRNSWVEEDIEPLLYVFAQVRDFFAVAAEEGNVVLLSHH